MNKTPTPHPSSFDPARARTALHTAFGPRAAVAHWTLLAGGASDRRYVRLRLTGAAHPSCVAMLLPQDLRDEEASTATDLAEYAFLNVHRHLRRAGVPVPEIFAVDMDNRILLLEDLGDTTLCLRIGDAPDTMTAWYLAATEVLAAMHAAMWPVPGDCVAGRRSFDESLLRWELDHFVEWGLEARLGTPVPPPLRRLLDEQFDALAAQVASLPSGFVHRDYQSRNLMVRSGEPRAQSLCVIDFQDALTGPRIYDLVALLNDSYVDIPTELKRRVIAHYAALRNEDEETLWNEFLLVTVQRKLKDGGRFVYIDRVKRDPSFLPYVSAAFSRAREALGALPQWRPLGALLHQADPTAFFEEA